MPAECPARPLITSPPRLLTAHIPNMTLNDVTAGQESIDSVPGTATTILEEPTKKAFASPGHPLDPLTPDEARLLRV